MLLVAFLALIIGPSVAGKYATDSIAGILPTDGALGGLIQPVGLNNTYAVYGTITGNWPAGNVANGKSGVSAGPSATGGGQSAGSSAGGTGGGGQGGGLESYFKRDAMVQTLGL